MRATTERARRGPTDAERRRDDAPALGSLPPHLRHLVHLQRTAGNAAATRLLTGRDTRYAGLLAHYAAGGAAAAGGPVAQRQPKPRPAKPAAQRPPATVDVRVDMPVPPVPKARYAVVARNMEEANLHAPAAKWAQTEPVTVRGREHSYVRAVAFELRDPRFEFLISDEVEKNRAQYPDARGAAGKTWTIIDHRLRIHAAQHFKDYAAVLTRLAAEFKKRLALLPSGRRLATYSQATLTPYVYDLLDHLEARLDRALYDAKCAWETKDYPTVFKDTGHGPAPKPDCGPRPTVPAEPVIVRARP